MGGMAQARKSLRFVQALVKEELPTLETLSLAYSCPQLPFRGLLPWSRTAPIMKRRCSPAQPANTLRACRAKIR